ncbi:MAG: Hsp20/alpha crystallin family protein, partial [Pseudomonadota bacterium]
EALAKLDTLGEGEIRQDHTFESAKGPIRASAGIRIRPAGGAAPAPGSRRPETPINTPKSTPQSRPIAATILDDGALWQLIADLPGVDRAGIALALADGHLVITAEGRGRRFEGRFEMPSGADLDALTVGAQNGILEIAFRRPEAP